MNYNILENIQYCREFVEPLRTFIYYSHFLPAFIALLIGFFVFFQNKKLLLGKILLAFALVFAAWVSLNALIWLNYDNGGLIMSAWAPIEIFSVLLFFLAFYFVYVFIEEKDISLKWKLLSAALLAPIIIFAPTIFNLKSYDIQECIATEGILYINYVSVLKLVLALTTFLFALHKLIITKGKRSQITLLTLGIGIFLYSRLISGYISEQILDFRYELYGLFGMIVFVGILAYLIVKYQVFNIKLIATQTLVTVLIILSGSQFLFVRNPTSIILTAVTLLFILIFGYFLVRSVKREVVQREQIEKLAKSLNLSNKQLYVANERLKELDKRKTEFLSLASHQLRSPLTAIKGYASMILEGDFGEMNAKIKEAVGVVFESSQKLVLVIEDFLDVTRIELGRMKYAFDTIKLDDIAKEVIKEQQPTLENRHLTLALSSEVGEYLCYGDGGKIKQVMSNLIDNAVKYTKEGTISVALRHLADEKGSKVLEFSVKDSGVGIAPETLPHLFEKFSRADDASKTNIIGTGLGLFVAKQIVDAHGGKIWAESAGKGKGATFFIRLYVSKGHANVSPETTSTPGTAKITPILGVTS